MLYWKIVPSNNIVPENLEKILIKKIPELKYTGKVLLDSTHLDELDIYYRDYSRGSNDYCNAIAKIIFAIRACGQVELRTKNLIETSREDPHF